MPVSVPTHDQQIYVPQPQFAANSNPANSSSSGDDAGALLGRLADLLSNKRERLPRLEPEVFNGDLLKFPVWFKSVEALIESHTDSPSDRLDFLSKYTSGIARECIQGFLAVDSYSEAKACLVRRFGDKYKISEAFKRKIRDWPVIRPGDGEGLQKSDFLQHCDTAMASISYLRSLDSAEENKNFLRKLPRYITNRWSRKVDQSLFESEEGNYPSFSEFSKFITHEARTACGPVNLSGDMAKKDTKNQGHYADNNKVKKFGSFSTNTNKIKQNSDHFDKRTNTNKALCWFCDGEHKLDKCKDFLKKSKDEKKTFVSKKGLCFGCFGRGHLFTDCRRRNPTLMNDDTSVKVIDQSVDDKNTHTVTSHKININKMDNGHVCCNSSH